MSGNDFRSKDGYIEYSILIEAMANCNDVIEGFRLHERYDEWLKQMEKGVQWKENGYTMKGISREMFYRAEGLEVANTKHLDNINHMLYN